MRTAREEEWRRVKNRRERGVFGTTRCIRGAHITRTRCPPGISYPVLIWAVNLSVFHSSAGYPDPETYDSWQMRKNERNGRRKKWEREFEEAGKRNRVRERERERVMKKRRDRIEEATWDERERLLNISIVLIRILARVQDMVIHLYTKSFFFPEPSRLVTSFLRWVFHFFQTFIALERSRSKMISSQSIIRFLWVFFSFHKRKLPHQWIRKIIFVSCFETTRDRTVRFYIRTRKHSRV